MSATATALDAIQAQRQASELLARLQAGSALPDALGEALQSIPPEHRRDYLRVSQKHIEGGVV